jgi:hypothetical protein
VKKDHDGENPPLVTLKITSVKITGINGMHNIMITKY